MVVKQSPLRLSSSFVIECCKSHLYSFDVQVLKVFDRVSVNNDASYLKKYGVIAVLF